MRDTIVDAKKNGVPLPLSPPLQGGRGQGQRICGGIEIDTQWQALVRPAITPDVQFISGFLPPLPGREGTKGRVNLACES